MQPLEIIEKLPDQSKREFIRSRRECELKWIKKLQTAYPLGLNDNIMGQGNISQRASINIMNISSPKLRHRRSHGRRQNYNIRHKKKTNITVKDLYIIFKNNGRHGLFTRLCSIPITNLYKISLECDTMSFNSPLYECSKIIDAFCYHRLYPRIDQLEDHVKHFLKIKYINKGIDLIDISSIFRDHEVQNLIPVYFDNREMPVISYSYKRPSRSLIFNYPLVTSDADIEKNYPNTCDCSTSPYRYDPSGHVLTGDVNIIKDKEVRQFLLKGPKYRPASKINWQACQDLIKDAVTTYCSKWCKRESADSHALNQFKNKVFSIVAKRVEHYQKEYVDNPKKLSVNRIKTKLKDLGEKYVFVPVDKAANNVSII